MKTLFFSLAVFLLIGSAADATELFGLGEPDETTERSNVSFTWKTQADDASIPRGFGMLCSGEQCFLVALPKSMQQERRAVDQVTTKRTVQTFGLNGTRRRTVTRSYGSTGTTTRNYGSGGGRTVTRYRTETRREFCASCPSGYRLVNVRVPYQVVLNSSNVSTVAVNSSLANHLQNDHGVNVAGMSYSQMVAEHNRIHNAERFAMRYNQTTVTTFARPRLFRPRTWFPRLRLFR